jgi:protein phosphatase 2C family protein 2/3
VNTNEGIVRSYNEDRVSIILNITKNGQKAFYFAIYDGHGGNNCCDFLSTHLHQYILNSKKFPSEPRQAIVEGIKMAEVEFMTKVKRDYLNSYDCDKSGSCILLTLIVGDECYIANVGDSRAVLSTENGKLLYSLSRDHKPTDSKEQERIMKEGGKIYRTEIKKKESKSKK